MIISQPISGTWNSLWTLVFVIFILDYCSRCHSSVFDVKGGDFDEPDVLPHKVRSPTSSSSINCTSQDARGMEPTAAAKVITQSASTTRRVVVFDIDQTLCCTHKVYNRRKSHPSYAYALNFTECPHIWFTWQDEPYLIVFLPHLQILFNYLLEHDVRIAFFSVGQKERNVVVIPELLESFWGCEKYEALKLKGQFRIHGTDDLRASNASLLECGNYVKDLRRIIQDGESLSNTVLVEDDSYYRAHDQEPIILVGMFLDEFPMHDHDYNPLNNVYYLLGLFQTYFENEKYEKSTFRKAMSRILPKNREHARGNVPFSTYFPGAEHPFVQEMVDLGFAAVREKVPNAVLYQKWSSARSARLY